MNVNEIANKARNVISDYCINECHSYCCRKGFLMLSDEEVSLMIGNKKEGLEKDGFLIKTKEGNAFDLSGGCPSLKDNKCLIHKNEKRNSACKDFPIFIKNKVIGISDRCPAKKEGLFYPYEHEFLKMGYKIE